jgi:hypothetical protein
MREDSTYDLPAIGKPPEPPMLRKIALEEHFNLIAPQEHASSNTGLQALHDTPEFQGRDGERIHEHKFNRRCGVSRRAAAASILGSCRSVAGPDIFASASATRPAQLRYDWIERVPISENDRRKIAHRNAESLFRLSST